MSLYDQLNVRRVVNAAATFTAVGGSLMPDPVLDAMRAAAASYVDMHELQDAAGSHLAALTHNEAAMVTSGCASALVLGTLGAITRGDPRVMAPNVPRTSAEAQPEVTIAASMWGSAARCDP